MINTENQSATLGTRSVFNGVQSEAMFVEQNAPLPELALGEILVKVIQ